ncbi:MAG: PorP/SprF family type IX secretion system membrane protein [Saprospiraceae bacterium]|nr:PorP/SprF family type IX secretion system membrane protein [Saprospiraceae bacterium]
MTNKILLVAISCCIFHTLATAQDVHFTRFYDAPTTISPASTGDYLGTFRAGAIMRDQNYNLSHIYLTPAGYIDAPLIRGFRDNHWVGVGLTFLMDQAGEAGLRTGAFTGSAAYHMGFNKKTASFLSIGISYSLAVRSVADKSKTLFEDELINSIPSVDIDNINDEKVNYGYYSAGLQFTSNLENRGNIRAGVAMMYLNRPRNGILKTANAKMPLRTNAYVTTDIPVSDRVDILPAAYYATMAKQSDLALQMQAGIRINPAKQQRIIGGLGYRFGDAIQILLGMDIKSTRIGLAYDLTTNAIKPTGALELAVSHIFMIYKKPKDNPIILCPRI